MHVLLKSILDEVAKAKCEDNHLKIFIKRKTLNIYLVVVILNRIDLAAISNTSHQSSYRNEISCT